LKKALNTYTAVGVGIIIVGLAIFFVYSADQARIRGFNFGSSLQIIQDELKQTQAEFYSKKKMLDEQEITKDEFLSFSVEHIKKMEEVVARYDALSPPQSFESSVKLFRLSTQKQIESDRLLIEWVRTNDSSNKMRSDLLLQESFETEMAALASFTKAKNPSG
jgi:hypothetical protein